MFGPDTIFFFAILIISIVIHEVSHGYAALALGDRTALLAGRLTLNPVKHVDLMGSFIVPLTMYISTMSLGQPVAFGWAKPVPYNPYNLSDQKWGEVKVALAGPLSNFIVAIVFAVLLRVFAPFWQDWGVSNVFVMIIAINVFLGFFNLVPIPPLDGSKLFFSILPYRYRHIQAWMEQWSLVLVLLLVFFLWDFVQPLVFSVVRLLIGG